MKALQIREPGVAALIDIPELQCAADGEVLLRVDLVGMCGTDLSTFRGANPLVSYPRIPGHEVAATVVQGSDDLAPGTAVTFSPYTECGQCASCRRGRPNACRNNQTMGVQRDGAMTEFISVPRRKIYTADLSLRELCLVEPLTIGVHAVARGQVAPGEVVAVFGCGGVGLGAVAAASFRGAATVAIDMDDRKLEIARRAGAKHAVHSGREDLHRRLQEITGGLGPDVAIEAIGLPSTFRSSVEELSFTGRVVYIGYTKEPVSYETKLFVQKELNILGSRNALPEDFQEVIQLLESGRFPVEDAVTATVAPEDAPELLAEWSAHPERFTKIHVQFHS